LPFLNGRCGHTQEKYSTVPSWDAPPTLKEAWRPLPGLESASCERFLRPTDATVQTEIRCVFTTPVSLPELP